MESILGIASLIGFGLLLIGYLLIVIASFKHHFVTGIIGMIPVLNLLVIPSTWHRASLGFILGTVGLIIGLGTWFGGGSSYVYQLLSMPDKAPTKSEIVEKAEEKTIKSVSLAGKEQTPEADEPPAENPLIRKKGVIVPLPDKPLYRLVYETIEQDDLDDLKGDYIRVTDELLAQYEGKLLSLGDDRLVLLIAGKNTTLTFKELIRLEKIVKQKQ